MQSEVIKRSVKNIQGGEMMEQKYEIEATINGVVLVCQGSIESKGQDGLEFVITSYEKCIQ